MLFIVMGEGNSDIGLLTQKPGPLVYALEALAREVSEDRFEFRIVNQKDLRAYMDPKK